MPFSKRSSNSNKLAVPSITLRNQYALRHCMADTALGKIYWAHDTVKSQNTNDSQPVLVFVVLPTLVQNIGFEQALRQVIPTFQQASPHQPQIIDHGRETDGTLWLAFSNTQGTLLSERIQELDERGMPVDDTFTILANIVQAIGVQRPDGVSGFIETGALLKHEQDYILLNAPVTAALRLMNSNNQNALNRYTYHSSYISPEVALGEHPNGADDTFSLAAIAYTLLQGHLPFGENTSLEAAVRNITPVPTHKLKPEAWQTLQQNLNFKREQRLTSPPTFVKTLEQKQHKKRLLLPVATLVALSVGGYAGYHLLGSTTPDTTPENALITTTPVPTTTLPSANVPTENNTASLVGETTAPALKTQETQPTNTSTTSNLALNTETATTTPSAQTEIDTLLNEARTAISQGRILTNNENEPAATTYLQKLLKLDPNNGMAQQLLTQMLNDQHAEAENLLAMGKPEDAQKVLQQADKIITDFNLIDSIAKQVRIEAALNETLNKTTDNKTDTSEEDKVQANQYIDRANHAINEGNLTEAGERSESAVQYIEALMSDYPENPQGLTLMQQVVKLQQDKALAALRRGNTAAARKLLDGSQTLIGRYNLEKQVETQLALEKRYRDAGSMGIFPSEPPRQITNNNPHSTPQPTETHTTPPQKTENSATARPAASISENTNKPRPSTPAAVIRSVPAPTTPITPPVESNITYDPNLTTVPNNIITAPTTNELPPKQPEVADQPINLPSAIELPNTDITAPIVPPTPEAPPAENPTPTPESAVDVAPTEPLAPTDNAQPIPELPEVPLNTLGVSPSPTNEQ